MHAHRRRSDGERIPQLGEFEHKIADAGGTASAAVAHELSELGAGLRHLSGDLVMRLRGNYMTGW